MAEQTDHDLLVRIDARVQQLSDTQANQRQEFIDLRNEVRDATDQIRGMEPRLAIVEERSTVAQDRIKANDMGLDAVNTRITQEHNDHEKRHDKLDDADADRQNLLYGALVSGILGLLGSIVVYVLTLVRPG